MKRFFQAIPVYALYAGGIMILVMGIYGAISTASPVNPTPQQESAFFQEVNSRYGFEEGSPSVEEISRGERLALTQKGDRR